MLVTDEAVMLNAVPAFTKMAPVGVVDAGFEVLPCAMAVSVNVAGFDTNARLGTTLLLASRKYNWT